MRSLQRQNRQEQLMRLIDTEPLLTDSELARELGVSVATIRLDRNMLNVPELRARTRKMAERASSLLTSLKKEELFGEIEELDPDRLAVSVLATDRSHAFRHTDMIADHYIYMQAASLAIAAIKQDMVIVGSARARFKQYARVGDRLTACAKVGTHKKNKYAVSVRTSADDREIFIARFVVVAVDSVADRGPGDIETM